MAWNQESERMRVREREVDEVLITHTVEHVVRLTTGAESVDPISRWDVLQELVIPILELDYWRRNITPEIEVLLRNNALDLQARERRKYGETLELLPRYFSATATVLDERDKVTLLSRLQNPYRDMNPSQIVDLLSRKRGWVMEQLDEMFTVGRGFVFSHERLLEGLPPEELPGTRRVWCVGVQAVGDRMKAFIGSEETDFNRHVAANKKWDSAGLSRWFSEHIQSGKKGHTFFPLQWDEIYRGGWYWNIDQPSINKPVEFIAAISHIGSFSELLVLLAEKDRFITKPKVVVVKPEEQEAKQTLTQTIYTPEFGLSEPPLISDPRLALNPRAQMLAAQGFPEWKIRAMFDEEEMEMRKRSSGDRYLRGGDHASGADRG